MIEQNKTNKWIQFCFIHAATFSKIGFKKEPN